MKGVKKSGSGLVHQNGERRAQKLGEVWGEKPDNAQWLIGMVRKSYFCLRTNREKGKGGKVKEEGGLAGSGGGAGRTGV